MSTSRNAAVILLAAAFATPFVRAPILLAGVVLCAFGFHAALSGGVRAPLRMAAPVSVFAGVVGLLQWLSGHGVTVLPMQTVAVCLLVTAAARLARWRIGASFCRPHTRLFSLVLFALFIRHFAAVLAVETRRTLQARALCVPNRYGRAAFSSLVCAVAALFARSLARAERFYAAQRLQGLAE
jgi:hypothetical protein